ncbi:2-dehydro-3-deoxygalactonokinase [Vibrio artabrorum]|uniref:2-dehydro-3-deoxygalactonokinase n=1 Tax=Vibrio artabrorum TaxID=446374 RepID=UPI003553C8A0
MLKESFILIDWGTSNFRAFLVNIKGEVENRTSAAMGLLQIKKHDFSGSLKGILEEWLPNYQDYSVLMGGMIGSFNGWHNVDYAKTPVKSEQLTDLAYRFKLPWGAEATIIPGVNHFYDTGCMNVMRGEEIQAFGLINILSKKNIKAIYPGTHSKHITIDNKIITKVDTFMTGEIFSLVSNYGILSLDLPEQENNAMAFEQGVRESGLYPLSQALFFGRTHRLSKVLSEKHIHSYLSGLLIGDELSTINCSDFIYIVGSEKLTNIYLNACHIKGINAEAISGDSAFLAGAIELQGTLNA